ncbi:MAG: DUF6573 family protein [Roseateles sp.]|uniref:DUF6573 family protein n=1 Tax=Roseateles sp. TaxID=1971397 RepID=UPI004036C3F4
MTATNTHSSNNTADAQFLAPQTHQPAGVVKFKIAQFRGAVSTLNWSRTDLHGSTRSEWLKQDVRSRLQRHIDAVEKMLPHVAARFAHDIDHARSSIQSAAEMIARWAEAKASENAGAVRADKPAAPPAMASLIELFGEPIHTVTRADLIEMGDLVDVSATAKEAGFKIPVALTRAVWADCVEWFPLDTKRTGAAQDEAGRLWDVLCIAMFAAQQNKSAGVLTYQLRRVARDGHGITPQLVDLKMICSGGDNGEPVITILQPLED